MHKRNREANILSVKHTHCAIWVHTCSRPAPNLRPCERRARGTQTMRWAWAACYLSPILGTQAMCQYHFRRVQISLELNFPFKMSIESGFIMNLVCAAALLYYLPRHGTAPTFSAFFCRASAICIQLKWNWILNKRIFPARPEPAPPLPPSPPTGNNFQFENLFEWITVDGIKKLSVNRSPDVRCAWKELNAYLPGMNAAVLADSSTSEINYYYYYYHLPSHCRWLRECSTSEWNDGSLHTARGFVHGKKLFIQHCQTIVVRAENFNLFCSNCCWCALSSRLFRSGEIDNEDDSRKEKESKTFFFYFSFVEFETLRMACERQRGKEEHRIFNWMLAVWLTRFERILYCVVVAFDRKFVGNDFFFSLSI